MTWTSTFCVVIMATYGRTLCWKKRNTVPNTGGVFAVRAIQQTMDITDGKRLRGTPLDVVGACSGPSGTPPVAPVAPNRCPCAVLLSAGRGVLHLAREGHTARFRHDGGTYCQIVEARLRGEGLSVFSRGVLMCLRQRGGVPVLSCMENIELVCWGCLRFMFRPCLPRFAVVIFTAIFPPGYPGADVTFR